jgi:predicted ATPase with chaperone activity
MEPIMVVCSAFVLAAEVVPCPCHFAGDPVREYACSPSAITRYQKRISGPLMDRIDIHLKVPPMKYEKLADRRSGETSQKVQDRLSKPVSGRSRAKAAMAPCSTPTWARPRSSNSAGWTSPVSAC